MDNRDVVKVKASPTSDYYWYCPGCKKRNEEVVVPGTSDLTCQECGANYKNGGSDLSQDKTPKCEIMTLNVLGAFESPMCKLCLYVEGAPGFNYVQRRDGEFITIGTLRPELVSWLIKTDLPEARLAPKWINRRLPKFPLGKMRCLVYYGSIHHCDER